MNRHVLVNLALSRGESEPQTASVNVGFHNDNIRWAPDGTLLAAGHLGPTPDAIFQCLEQDGACDGITARVARVNPESLEAVGLVRRPSDRLLPVGTIAIEVDDEILAGGIGGDRIVRMTTPAH